MLLLIPHLLPALHAEISFPGLSSPNMLRYFFLHEHHPYKRTWSPRELEHIPLNPKQFISCSLCSTSTPHFWLDLPHHFFFDRKQFLLQVKPIVPCITSYRLPGALCRAIALPLLHDSLSKTHVLCWYHYQLPTLTESVHFTHLLLPSFSIWFYPAIYCS